MSNSDKTFVIYFVDLCPYIIQMFSDIKPQRNPSLYYVTVCFHGKYQMMHQRGIFDVHKSD